MMSLRVRSKTFAALCWTEAHKNVKLSRIFSLLSKNACQSFSVRRFGLTSSRNAYKKVLRPEDFKLVSRPAYEPPSLAEHLRDRIRLGGPITVAEYMKAVLTHPRKGYYTQGDVFGASGDFTTSPEISPLFGELLGVWLCHELHKIGSPRPLQVVELGPGRGTLTADILRVFKQLPPGDANVSVHLVEISDRLAQIQATRLGATELTQQGEDSAHYQNAVTEAGLSIYWYKDIQKVPRGFSVFIAHEFFDALPVHKLQKIDNTWREVQVTLKDPTAETPEFELVASRTANPPASLVLSPAEKRGQVEVCLEGVEIVAEMAQRIEEDGGVALIVDYGHEGSKTDTFRAFKSHQLHDPLREPGTADLTADVDFAMLKQAAGERVVTYGPVNQGDFLRRMGIDARLQKLSVAVPQQADALKSGVKMVTEEMGERFKFLAMFPAVLKDHLAKFPVAGFHSPPTNSKR